MASKATPVFRWTPVLLTFGPFACLCTLIAVLLSESELARIDYDTVAQVIPTVLIAMVFETGAFNSRREREPGWMASAQFAVTAVAVIGVGLALASAAIHPSWLQQAAQSGALASCGLILAWLALIPVVDVESGRKKDRRRQRSRS